MPSLINVTPDPTIIQLGPLVIGWYALGYLAGLAVMFAVTMRELERRGIERQHLWNAGLLVAIFAIVGGRLYHVIHEWDLIYAADPIRAILPIAADGRIGFAGLGLYGGIIGALVGLIVYGLWARVPIRLGVDAVIPGTLFAQAIARWGNFFNQELYGPPTDAPWGIAIECHNRVAQYPCAQFPFETTGFHPLFFYESALTLTGGLIALWLSRRYLGAGLRAGDLTAFWAIWYGGTRFVLETFRDGWNWTLGGIATAQLVSLIVIAIGIALIAWNHRPGRPPDPVPVDVGRGDHGPPSIDEPLPSIDEPTQVADEPAHTEEAGGEPGPPA
ncbi:prolipoprotein diacylglyceryl transferase [soil metagenome]